MKEIYVSVGHERERRWEHFNILQKILIYSWSNNRDRRRSCSFFFSNSTYICSNIHMSRQRNIWFLDLFELLFKLSFPSKRLVNVKLLRQYRNLIVILHWIGINATKLDSNQKRKFQKYQDIVLLTYSNTRSFSDKLWTPLNYLTYKFIKIAVFISLLIPCGNEGQWRVRVKLNQRSERC